MNRPRNLAVWALVLVTVVFVFAGDARSGPASIWPSVMAVALAFLTRDIYTSLFAGAFAGTILLAHGNLFAAFINLFAHHMIPPLTDRWNVSALAFSLMMGGFVEVLNRIGGMQVLAVRALGRGDSKRRAGLGVFAMGWVVFFDGLASSMLVGKTMRPITDRARMSREKLAFVVDSTASPIAAFALISTWIAFELTLIQNGLAAYGATAFGDAASFAGQSSYRILLETLPYRFYNYFVLLIVFLTVWLGRDLGPMRAAERAAADSPAAEPMGPSPAPSQAAAPGRTVEDDGAGGILDGNRGTGDRRDLRRIVMTLLPVVLLVVSVFGGLYVDGLSKLGVGAGGDAMQRIIQAFGQADADIVFVTATAFASVIAMLLLWLNRAADSAARPGPGATVTDSPPAAFFDGMRQMFLPVLILVFAFTLGSVIQELETANWLVGVLDGSFPAAALPAVVFVLAALTSFSVGSAWGTMGVLTPLCVPIAGALTGLPAGAAPGPVMVATLGAILAGAVFGDHCSPISDTTIVSAFASGCDVIDHVRTQIPYALLGAGIAVFLGYLPAGMSVSPFLLLPLGGITCWAAIRYVGKRP